ncbi:hypothetical protein ILUMI_11876 [Ignelater luminosus]|uniref:C-type lectin domain-containing protein n=1 Tax=Ignelater luminosus TaxID=2038154 RepID=A0A8K0GCB9_IGNLU|nr:hypothetical protein ILUMI_11876 [Ignelater luminosus]
MRHLSHIIIVQFIIISILVKLIQNQTTPGTAEIKPPAAQVTDPERPSGPTTKKKSRGFLEFRKISNIAEAILIRPKEYIIVHQNLSFEKAFLACTHIYKGNLAVLNDKNIIEILAQALSETNRKYDTLWTAGKIDRLGLGYQGDDQWVWKIYNFTRRLNITGQKNASFALGEKNCLGFGRFDHEEPQFRLSDCKAPRPYICERPQGSGNTENSTSLNWINLGTRSYKLYYDKVNYEVGRTRCFSHDTDADLAVIPDYNTAEQLVEYLLMGRPSFENVWIGGKRRKGHFFFEPEDLALSDTTDSKTGYPPWVNGKVPKKFGCLMLDRHESHIVAFEPAECNSERAILCYKKRYNVTFVDIIFEDFGYRLYLEKLPWEEARSTCNIYKQYSAKLAEINVEQQVRQLLYVMGGNYSYVQHIWLGGLYENGKWIWNSTGNVVEDSLMHWVKNSSFDYNAEYQNTCLNMDRENLVTALHYGTVCDFEQHFVCLFPADELKRLQKDRPEENEGFLPNV